MDAIGASACTTMPAAAAAAAAAAATGASAPRSATAHHAIELADAARAVLGTDWGIGETGVAGEPTLVIHYLTGRVVTQTL